MENEQRVIPATNLPEGWAWRLYDDGSGGLFSPENKSVVEVDFATSEYRREGEWHFMSGYPYETVSSGEFMDSMEKIVRSSLERKGNSLDGGDPAVLHEEPDDSMENGALREFDVTITETLQKTVTVEAADQLEAELIVNDAWYTGDYILDAESFTGVEFEAKPADRELTRDVKNNEKGENHTMSENTATPASDNTPLAENEYVKQLFNILQDNGKDASGLVALIGHVGEMESFVKRAEDKIADMKAQLSEMKEVQNHPVKTYLQNAIKTLETKVAAVKEQLAELKSNIVEGCKNAVSAFKEKGITALDKLASFFHIKQGLQDWKKDIDSGIRADDKAVAKIEAFASEYHSAGRAVKNMARVAVGKQPVDAKKEAGKLAKTLAAPYKAQKAALTGLRKSIDKTIAKLDQLEATATKQAERAAAKKPSMLAKLDANKERVEREKRELPAPERTKTQAVEV